MTEKEVKKINELVAEKIMGLRPQIDFGTWSEHDWRLDDDGQINTMAFEFDNHNGPACSRCFYSYCHHCQDGPNEPCEKEAPDYAASINKAMQVVDKLKEKYVVEIQIDKDSVECKLMNEYPDNEDKLFTALAVEGETVPLAICLAALETIK